MNLYAIQYADDPTRFHKATSADSAYRAHTAGYDPEVLSRLSPEKFVIDRIDTLDEFMLRLPAEFVVGL